MSTPTTLFDKVWRAHEVHRSESGQSLLWIDRHFVHEGSFHAFNKLAERALPVARPDLTFGIADHYVPTLARDLAGVADWFGSRFCCYTRYLTVRGNDFGSLAARHTTCRSSRIFLSTFDSSHLGGRRLKVRRHRHRQPPNSRWRWDDNSLYRWRRRTSTAIDLNQPGSILYLLLLLSVNRCTGLSFIGTS